MKSCSHGFKGILFLILIFSLPAGVFAESKITARGQGVYRKAEVKIYLNENIYYAGKNKIEFGLKGLEPNGLYTIWLLKGSAMAGVGKAPYSFFTDNSGKAAYTGEIEAYKLGDWQTIKIVRHKDSVAENMDQANLVTVFLVGVSDFLSGKKAVSEDQGAIKPRISIYKGPLKIIPPR